MTSPRAATMFASISDAQRWIAEDRRPPTRVATIFPVLFHHDTELSEGRCSKPSAQHPRSQILLRRCCPR